jgi:aminoglycoside phosphotransferase (APT) family kinase protein
MNESFQPLLTAVELALTNQQDEFSHAGWALRRIYGGMNGIIYRAENRLDEQVFAVKIRRRDERNRAGREFAALQTLSMLAQPPAPRPIALYPDLPQFPGDIIISAWVDGLVLDELPGHERDLWGRILAVCARVHSIAPGDAPAIRDAVLPIRSARDVMDEIQRRYTRLPDVQLGDMTKAEMGIWLEIADRYVAQNDCAANRLGLITCDTNPSNMIDSDGRIMIVDWENSGWGDPAFDIADLLVRPNCAGLSPQDRAWVMGHYAEIAGDSRLVERIAIYERLMLLFWLVLTSNGFAPSTVARLPGTRTFSPEHTLRQQRYYLRRLESARDTRI